MSGLSNLYDILEEKKLPFPLTMCDDCGETMFRRDPWIQCPDCGAVSTIYGGCSQIGGVSDEWVELCKEAKKIVEKWSGEI